MKHRKENKIIYFQAEFKEIPQENAEIGTRIKGYASTPTKDRYNDIVEPSAFTDSIQQNYRKNPIILFQHNSDRPIGKATHLSIDNDGLYIEALIVDAEIEPKIKAGILKTFSIGYVPQEVAYIDSEGNSLDISNPSERDRIFYDDTITRVIKKLDLVENSIVSVPANPDALFDLSKSVKSYFQKQIELFKNNSLKTEAMNKKDNLLEVKEEAIPETQPETPQEKPEVVEPKTEDVKVETETTEEVETPAVEGAEISEEVTPETPVEATPEVESEEKHFSPFSEDDKKTLKQIATPCGAVVALKAIRALESEIKALNDIVANTPKKEGLAFIESSAVNKGEVKETNKTEKGGFKNALISSAII